MTGVFNIEISYMRKTYKAKKGSFIKRLFILFIILPVIIFVLDQAKFIARPYLILPYITPIILVIWAYFDTFYRIENDKLYYRFSYVRGFITIEDIHTILKGANLRKGKKPALSNEGLVIEYQEKKKLFIAPEDRDDLIEALLQINPEIRLVD